jgi:hypothetical protein
MYKYKTKILLNYSILLRNNDISLRNDNISLTRLAYFIRSTKFSSTR